MNPKRLQGLKRVVTGEQQISLPQLAPAIHVGVMPSTKIGGLAQYKYGEGAAGDLVRLEIFDIQLG